MVRGVAWIFAFAAVAGGVVWLLVSRRSDAGSERLLADLSADIERGSLADLGRAQAVGRRMAFSRPHDREAASRWAFASAALAADYGVDTSRETADALARVGGADSTDPASVIAAAARALDLLHAGDREAAGRLAAESAGVASDLPHPLYALGRARARNGDLPGAARALEAAMIRAPGFTAARVAWAEVQLDLGDAKAARAALQTLRAQAPNDPHVALLLNEAEAWLGVPATPLPFEGCPADRWQPPSIVAACTLARAERARRDGSRSEARMLAESAAAIVPDEPRLLSRTAEALAQLGVVDRAATLVERARRLMAPNVPALAWAVAAVSLGRGRAGALPTGARPADPELRLLVARASLAAGGVGALSSTLDELGTDAIARDADLAEVARLRGAGAGIAHAVADDPARAYIEGLRARLDGKLEVAANRLRQALSGHGDACRAAGEYRATLRAFKQKPDAAVFLPLRAENAGCVNLPRP
ncbi:MAG TPA: tetratricopeptide repeat protein [Polyangia bacterium]|nr:tetratricopeptide repeat protein [Polyangia bacterium]